MFMVAMIRAAAIVCFTGGLLAMLSALSLWNYTDLRVVYG
jgi:hypothetical protein